MPVPTALRRALRRSLTLTATAAVLTGIALPAAHAAGPASRSVTYRGHQFTVPAGWDTVDLDRDPRACVRFDRHTLYYGTPSTDQDCPSHLVGRTEALLVQPAGSRGADQARTDRAAHQLAAGDAQVRLTGTYDSDPGLVEDIATDAGLTLRSASSPEPAPSTLTAASLSSSSTHYTGKGFDACAAPSASAMNAWNSSSPYGAVGIYIGGAYRACSQPNLTASWVSQQASAGWHFIPIYVGVQAADITSPTAQGTSAADDAITQAASLGFPAGSVLYYDMEAYSSSDSSDVLSFLSAWTKELHARGYDSGVYSSSSSGISDLADHYGSGYQMPDVIYDALWNGSADTGDPAVPSTLWANHQRIHQYSGGHTETYGGVSINIDSDYLDVAPTASAVPHGTVWDRTRGSSGTWAGSSTEIDDNDAITAVASAALPDGTLHTFTVVPGSGVWERVRSASGTWAANAVKMDDNDNIVAVSAAALKDGTLHVDVVVKNSGVWDRTRKTDGTWTAATKIDDNPSVTRVAAAGLTDGSLHLETLVPGSGIWERVRSASGTWQTSATQIDTNGNITALATVALPDGTQRIEAVVPGSGIWDRVRNTAGNWQASTQIDTNGDISAVSAAALPDGSMTVDAVVPGSGVWDRARSASGTWQGSATKVDANGGVFAVQSAGLPDGTVHLQTIV
ncbi:glycoside hydrolase domain-containing protein [Streptomyces sp. NPDC017673]|uniref:glycoside hydrolase domain-containing protein n=1 Tax=unclassified Streptomyces TaxID=2593676 RepID=UPI0037962D03